MTSVAFAADGRQVLIATEEGIARFWQTDWRDLLAYACSRLFRDFTPRDRRLFAIGDDAPTCASLRAWTFDRSSVRLPL